MCGITGIFNYRDPGRPVNRSLLMRMTRRLAHRGPDGEGFHVDGPIGLGHRRLAIVDLSPTGAQPMASGDGSCWIVYNGEFYNHADFRGELSRRHAFRGTSDTETLLYLLEDKGGAALADLAAIFGLAFWDERRRALLLARDPLGVKQVYYHDDGERIVFASEIKAILEDPTVPREVDTEGLNQYLHFHTPLFERTFYRGIRQLLPGEYLEVPIGGRPRRTRYWQVENYEEHVADPAAESRLLQERIGAIVREQLMSDVPLGTFFSGGIDSSLVAEYAKRAGKSSRCFGVYFSGQGVIDERPFQEEAARAMGLELELVTMDGSTFDTDMAYLMYHQDQPMIGAAMLPMYHVSKLASRKVKVCLGGQGADELFGGYARYALTHPLRLGLSMVQSQLPGLRERQRDSGVKNAVVGGNLAMQLFDRRNLGRIISNARNISDWRELYFGNFCLVPEAEWKAIFDDGETVSRENCWMTFRDTVDACQAQDPGTKAMSWDAQTYLPGLYHQDDRMSMANGLESRVPLSDPRLVKFAFRVPFDLKFRDGASKWILRQAVADVLPARVLGRRKVGFDTPLERWMGVVHADFVRETLLSSRARGRGFWDTRVIEGWLGDVRRTYWRDVVWKLLSIEVWAQTFLDQGGRHCEDEQAPAIEVMDPVFALEEAGVSPRDVLRELAELGVAGTVFRTSWELRTRAGVTKRCEPTPAPLVGAALPGFEEIRARLPFPEGQCVVAAIGTLVAEEARNRLRQDAVLAAEGRIRCFGRWLADYGDPVDWQVNPVNGRRWRAAIHWTHALDDEPRVGDIKLSWEAARFPQAYLMTRAAAFDPTLREALAAGLARQIDGFVRDNPYGDGIHWASGQEITFRMMAWLYGLSVLGPGTALESSTPLIVEGLNLAAHHVERYLDYTRKAVYNNHLLSEALCLLLAGMLLPQAARAGRWRETGLHILTREADQQVYRDGGYIQLSHNYHRAAMQVYLWATALLRKAGESTPEPWRACMERSLAFLYVHQNPTDGRLPNYGANDGALPMILSTCDYSDFRAGLQSLAYATRGERIYPPGPWDEEVAWLFGPGALEAPLREMPRKSLSFAGTGFHVMHGKAPGTFAAFRCGTIRDRFSQIDMLHLDVWWRGENVLVDGGSYLYNGPKKWHDHFYGTGCHNTLTVDGRDQMKHYRKFKSLYWTEAKLLGFENQPRWLLVAGEHYGYRRLKGAPVHRRSVLQVNDGLWVVVDRVAGEGQHDVRLQWLGGEYGHEYDCAAGTLVIKTGHGDFHVTVMDRDGRPLAGDVVTGAARPPRGWLSRYYGEKVPVPSLAVRRRGILPLMFVTVLSGGRASATVEGERWQVRSENGVVGFRLTETGIGDVKVQWG